MLFWKKPNLITKYCNNENDIENFSNLFYLFILFFYRYFDIEAFKNLLLNSEKSKTLIKLIFNYPNRYGLLTEETLSKIYNILNNNEEFEKIITLSKNVEDSLLFILNHIQVILEEYKKNNKKIDIYNLVKPRK